MLRLPRFVGRHNRENRDQPFSTLSGTLSLEEQIGRHFSETRERSLRGVRYPRGGAPVADIDVTKHELVVKARLADIKPVGMDITPPGQLRRDSR